MKFKYGDNVKVMRGFYSGWEGKIVDRFFWSNNYWVTLNDGTRTLFSSKDLVLLE